MKSENFKKLQAKWYKKLAKSGFEDIEDTQSPREMLKRWDSLYFLSRYTPEQFKAKEAYYIRAAQFLESHVFETAREKAIWAEHTSGRTMGAIAKRRRVSIKLISKIIRRLEGVMFGKSGAKGA